MTAVPTRLLDCKTRDQKIASVKNALESGKSLADTRLWLAGVEPESVIRSLRRSGLPIGTVSKRIKDAEGYSHRDLTYVLTWV